MRGEGASARVFVAGCTVLSFFQKSELLDPGSTSSSPDGPEVTGVRSWLVSRWARFSEPCGSNFVPGQRTATLLCWSDSPSSGDEDAFATLLGRYGPLVLRACRQILAHEQDVEDAFQATFLVLARKAGSLHARRPLAVWLHEVACRVAMEARRRNARRRHHEAKGAVMPPRRSSRRSKTKTWGPCCMRKSSSLPAKYRQPMVLCYFDGQTHDQAAAQLGWPVGTVKTRLSRGRDLLQTRLVRRGVTASAAAFASLLSASRGNSSGAGWPVRGHAPGGHAHGRRRCRSGGPLGQRRFSGSRSLTHHVPVQSKVDWPGSVAGRRRAPAWDSSGSINRATPQSQAAAPVDPAQVKADFPERGQGQHAVCLRPVREITAGKGQPVPVAVQHLDRPGDDFRRCPRPDAGPDGKDLAVSRRAKPPACGLWFVAHGEPGWQGVSTARRQRPVVPDRRPVPGRVLDLNETHYEAKPNGVGFRKATRSKPGRRSTAGWRSRPRTRSRNCSSPAR